MGTWLFVCAFRIKKSFVWLLKLLHGSDDPFISFFLCMKLTFLWVFLLFKHLIRILTKKKTPDLNWTHVLGRPSIRVLYFGALYSVCRWTKKYRKQCVEVEPQVISKDLGNPLFLLNILVMLVNGLKLSVKADFSTGGGLDENSKRYCF